MGFDLTFYLIDHRLIAAAMVVALVAAGEIGLRLGSRRRDAPESFRALVSGIGAAMFGVLGLLLGFTLAMAIGRWDERRDLLVDESNAIGTLALRAGLVEQPVRGELRASLREYIDTRIAMTGVGDDLDAWRVQREKSETLHSEIWAAVERAGASEMNPAKLSALISATNELIDIHELRLAAIENYLPASLMLLLTGIAVVAIYHLAWSFGAAGPGGRAAILFLGLVIAAILLMIMDINRPQRGAFTVGAASLERARAAISEAPAP